MDKPVANKIHLVFVNTLANSNKFWKAKANNNGALEITWGRVGYNGQTKIHEYGSYSNTVRLRFVIANVLDKTTRIVAFQHLTSLSF